MVGDYAKSTFNENVPMGLGLFGGLYRFEGKILVSSTDSVGTKLKIAGMAKNHKFVGFDIVNHCINDIITLGAVPLFFLDYVAFSKLDPGILLEILKSLSEACKEAKVALIGGETAQLPGYFKPDDYDLVGFVTGVVDDDKLITGKKIRVGDRLIGLPSSGLHTNGFSLARKVFFKKGHFNLDHYFPEIKKTLGDELLTPHRLYLDEVIKAQSLIKGLVHITGGGFIDNIPRILPEEYGVVIKKANWEVPPIFKLIESFGSVPELEMFRTFNMGIGMILIVEEGAISKVIELTGGIEIGEVINKEGVSIE